MDFITLENIRPGIPGIFVWPVGIGFDRSAAKPYMLFAIAGMLYSRYQLKKTLKPFCTQGSYGAYCRG